MATWVLIANTKVSALVVTMAKIVGDAGLGISQIGEDEPVPSFKFFCFKARPPAST